MSAFLLRQFKEGATLSGRLKYVKVFGHKSAKVVDSVIPSLTQNLVQSSSSFLEGLISYDTEFIQSIASVALQKRLLPEMENLRKKNVEINFFDRKIDGEDDEEVIKALKEKPELKAKVEKVLFTSPYVIFGQSMEQRVKQEDPWANCYSISSNRFIYKDPSGFSLKNIMNKHIYGFNCFYTQNRKGLEITEGGKTDKYNPKQMVISFETDSVNEEFFVTDFNHVVWQGKYEKQI